MVTLLPKRWKKSTSPRPPCAHQAQLERDQHRELVLNSDSSQQRGTPDHTPAGTTPSVRRDAEGKCTSCKEERSAASKYRWRVIAGLIFPFALQALDVTLSVARRGWCR